MRTLFSASRQPASVSDDESDETDDGLLGDPERFEPSLGPDVPEVDIPGQGDADDAGETTDLEMFPDDVEPEVSRTFWRLVVVFDVALLALAVGPMFIYFRGNWELGSRLLILGGVTLAYGVYRYRRFRKDRADDRGRAAGD